MKRFGMLSAVCVLLGLTACQSPQGSSEGKNSPYTHGNVQLTLKKGDTTQAEVLDKFGPPNIATIDGSGQEVWTYEKHATVSAVAQPGGYFTLLLLGAGAQSAYAKQSSRTMTLVIKFDADKKVSDFNSLTTSF